MLQKTENCLKLPVLCVNSSISRKCVGFRVPSPPESRLTARLEFASPLLGGRLVFDFYDEKLRFGVFSFRRFGRNDVFDAAKCVVARNARHSFARDDPGTDHERIEIFPSRKIANLLASREKQATIFKREWETTSRMQHGDRNSFPAVRENLRRSKGSRRPRF